MRIILPLLGLPVLGVVPLMSGVAMAAQPLTENQMDRVAAGFAAYTQPCDCVEVLTPTPTPTPTPTSTANEPVTPPPTAPFLTFCPPGGCPPPPPPANAPPSAQFSYMLTINGISLQSLLVKP
ncbi:MAG TPA: hypothetical protein VLX09_24295 [Stellaceae bacterium]|nr:hypothetical protein [Stellaceae bacterium]